MSARYYSFLLVLIFIIAVEAIPVPIPRYGVFIDEIRTTKLTDILRAKIAYYDGTGTGAYGAKSVFSKYATVDLSTGRVTENSLDLSDLVPIPEAANDSMFGYTLDTSNVANVTLIDPLNTAVVSFDFSDILARAQKAEESSDLSNIPTVSFVTEKLRQAYIFYPDVELYFSSYDINTRMIRIDLDTTLSESNTLSPDVFNYFWEFTFGFPNTDMLPERLPSFIVYDQEQLVLLPNTDPFSGNGPKVSFLNGTGIQVISRTNSYYFPFSNVMESVNLHPSGDANLNTLFEIHHSFTVQKEDLDHLDLEIPEWGVMIPETYEVVERAMTGQEVRRIILNKNDVIMLGEAVPVVQDCPLEPPCCEEDCCGQGTSWNLETGYCVVDPGATGFTGTYSDAWEPGCVLRACCTGDCCGKDTTYNELFASCIPI